MFFFASPRSSASASHSEAAMGQIQRPIQANVLRNGRVDQRVEILEADLREHGRARLLVGADVPSREGVGAVFLPRKSDALLASRFSVFRGRVRFGCGHWQNYGVRLPVQAKAVRVTGKREHKTKERRFETAFFLVRRFVNRRSLRGLQFRCWLETDRFARPGMGDGDAASHFEPGAFKQADQFVDVFPKEAFEESRVHTLVAALHCFNNEQSRPVSRLSRSLARFDRCRRRDRANSCRPRPLIWARIANRGNRPGPRIDFPFPD